MDEIKNKEHNSNLKIKVKNFFKKYKNIWILLAWLLLFLGGWGIAGQHIYNQIFYNKIPKIFKKDLKTYKDNPSLILYQDVNKLFPDEDMRRNFVYTSDNSGTIDFGYLDWKSNVVAEYLIWRGYDYTSYLAGEDLKSYKKDMLEKSLSLNYDISENIIFKRVSNLKWRYSPYKNSYFKRLDKWVSEKTYIAGYAEDINIELLLDYVEQSRLFNNPINILFNDTFLSDSINDKIKNILLYVDVLSEDNIWKIRIHLDMLWEEQYEEYGKAVCSQLEDNFKEFSSKIWVFLMSWKCSVNIEKWSMDFIFTFEWINSHIEYHTELEVDTPKININDIPNFY